MGVPSALEFWGSLRRKDVLAAQTIATLRGSVSREDAAPGNGVRDHHQRLRPLLVARIPRDPRPSRGPRGARPYAVPWDVFGERAGAPMPEMQYDSDPDLR